MSETKINPRVEPTIGYLRSQDPESIRQALDYLHHALWSRQISFANNFLASEGLSALISLLRPKYLDFLNKETTAITSTTLPIHPAVIETTWSSYIHCLSCQNLASLCRLLPQNVLSILAEEEGWLIDRLISWIEYGGELESYAALLALDGLALSGEMRSWIDVERLTKSMSDYLISTLVKSGSIRWKLAQWRALIELCHSVCAISDVDLFGFTAVKQVSLLFPVRSDSYCLLNDNLLLDSFGHLLEFMMSLIPKNEETTKGTVFSGPGFFAQSALQIKDLGVLTRSIIFLFYRFSVMDPAAKTWLLKNPKCIRTLRVLAQVFDENTRADIAQFLSWMGVGAPISQQRANHLKELIATNEPKDMLKCLKILDTSVSLVDPDQIIAFFDDRHSMDILFNMMHPTNWPAKNFHERIGSLKIQRHPLRDATIIPAQFTWKTVTKAFLAHFISLYCTPKTPNLLLRLQKEGKWIRETLLQMLRQGTELEKWGSSAAVATILNNAPAIFHEKDRDLLASAGIRILSTGATMREQKNTIFFQHEMLQWKIETWNSALDILDQLLFPKDASKALELRSLHQSGFIPSLMSILKHIADVHGLNLDRIDNMFMESHGKEQYYYHPDQTLSKFIYRVLCVIRKAAIVDEFTCQILLWPEHVCILNAYVLFGNSSVKREVEILVSWLISDLEAFIQNTHDRFERKQKYHSIKQLKFILSEESKGTVLVWPQHLSDQSLASLLYRDDSQNDSQQSPVDPSLIPYLVVKICSNPCCNLKETRLHQFQQSSSSDKWYCSKICLQMAERKSSNRSQLQQLIKESAAANPSRVSRFLLNHTK